MFKTIIPTSLEALKVLYMSVNQQNKFGYIV